MRLSDIEKKANEMGITEAWKLTKPELIKTIQIKEGNSSCFATTRACAQSACCWRSDCIK